MHAEAEFNWELDFPLIEPQINAQGVHVWPFDPSFPADIRFFECGHHHGVRMNRHDYFELVYVYSGEASFQIQDRSFTVRGGDLVMIGSTLYHRQLARTDGVKDRVVVLIFKPELIRTATAHGEDVEYLMPFYSQTADFPHVIPAETTVPARIFELIKDMYAEFPVTSSRARLAVRTYLKMVLILLVNHYADYLGTRKTFRDKQQSIKRLRPLFDWIDRHYADPVTVEDAAKICAMSASYFKKQTSDRRVFSVLLEPLPHCQGPGPACNLRKVNFRDQPGNWILRSELLRNGLSKGRSDDTYVLPSAFRQASS